MKIIKTVPTMQRLARNIQRPLVLVPTMGALHAAHLALVTEAKRHAGKGGTTVASIFVNSAQFGPNEDFQRYPRPFRQDCELLRRAGCDLVFSPDPDELYFADRSVSVVESSLSAVMCGASRSGHFSGVCTVVAKLFHIVQPDVAIFGEKDFQQLAILRRMVRDLNFPVRLQSHPTVRDSDGLALSSRNTFLSVAERAQAPIIYQTLLAAEQKVRAGWNSGRRLETWMGSAISKAKLAKLDYVVAVDPATLQRQVTLSLPVLLAAAVFFGQTRLIDNRLIE